MELDHLSYSSISTWLLCPRSWAFKYRGKIQIPTSAALVFGSAFHNTVEEYLRVRNEQTEAKLTDLWPQSWTAQLERNTGDIDWGSDTQEHFFNEGLRILGTDDIIDTVKNLQVKTEGIERFVELSVPGVPIPIIGYIDLIADDDVPIDLKTSSQAWSSGKAQSEIQPLFYLAALTQGGEVNHNFRFRHVVFTKTKNPQVQVIESQHSLAACFWLLTMIGEVWKAIDAGHFPCNPTGWKCSPKFCDFWAMCRGKP